MYSESSIGYEEEIKSTYNYSEDTKHGRDGEYILSSGDEDVMSFQTR